MNKKISGMSLKYDYLGLDAISFERSISNHLLYSVGKDMYNATQRDIFHTVTPAVRDRLIERWMETMRNYYRQDTKRVYYLSMEFLMGRTLINSLLNLNCLEECQKALDGMGIDLHRICDLEPDAALGNGGLGRLAACLLDSMATLRYPGYGYGIRYEYGMFNQRIDDGWQVEHPENWLRYGNPWEFPRPNILFPVKFNGRVVEYRDDAGHLRHEWTDADQVMAMAYDSPVPGYATNTTNNMRLWSAKATREFELKYFNEGNYIKAVEDKDHSENISRVLYPSDSTEMGRGLRFRQEYFFVSASLQDILRRFRKQHKSFDALPDKVAIQLNDTHPALAIPELMRLLLDVHGLDWDRAWSISRRTFSYTNHTLMPEALETWPVHLVDSTLPRHMQIIYEINQRLLGDVRHRYPGDADILRRMSLIDETGERRVRMANLAIVGSHKVNGVSQVHTDLMTRTIFSDFHRYEPDKIINITNGVTPRRWLHQANSDLSDLISSRIGRGWVAQLEQLEDLLPHAEDAAFRDAFMAVKAANKRRLADRIHQRLGIRVPADSLFDVQIKRIHEYKRQLLNILHIITRYNRLRANTAPAAIARTVIFSGKAAPGYTTAKLIIKLINDIADVVNNDPLIGDRLKVVFIPNYDVTTAADIIPAADLSQQISTAGTEASGTGNMKLALNGALTIGTHDGANVEIRQRVGDDNIFMFGLTTDQAGALRAAGYSPWDHYHANDELRQALDMIASGYFSPVDPGLFRPLFDALTSGGDHYLLLADYAAYVACQERVDVAYGQPQEWARKAILNVAQMGWFSSDRTIREYADRVWQVGPVAHE